MLIHGQASSSKRKATRTYRSWEAMVARCTNPKHIHYETYKDKLTTRWQDFTNFYEDMGDRPPSTSLDRINNSLGYYKENYRLADSKTQNRNKRSIKLSTEQANEIRHLYSTGNFILTELAEIYAVSDSTIKNCIYRGDWK